MDQWINRFTIDPWSTDQMEVWSSSALEGIIWMYKNLSREKEDTGYLNKSKCMQFTVSFSESFKQFCPRTPACSILCLLVVQGAGHPGALFSTSRGCRCALWIGVSLRICLPKHKLNGSMNCFELEDVWELVMKMDL